MDSAFRELARRAMYYEIIDRVIETHLIKDEKSHVRKGEVHDLVFDVLGITCNSRLRTLINKKMAAMGIRSVLKSGDRFYKGMRLKDESKEYIKIIRDRKWCKYSI